MLISISSVIIVRSEDGLVVEMEVDRTVISIGESVSVLLTLKNVGENNLTITFSPPLFDLYYDAPEGRFHWSDGKYFILLISSIMLEPGENCSETLQWNLYQYSKGQYVPPKPRTYNLWGKSRPIGIVTSSPTAVTMLSQLRSDLNGDGTVNILDIFIVAQAFGSKPEDSNWSAVADLNKDNTVNILDIFAVAWDLGKTV
jgi:hypothetical protein